MPSISTTRRSTRGRSSIRDRGGCSSPPPCPPLQPAAQPRRQSGPSARGTSRRGGAMARLGRWRRATSQAPTETSEACVTARGVPQAAAEVDGVSRQRLPQRPPFIAAGQVCGLSMQLSRVVVDVHASRWREVSCWCRFPSARLGPFLSAPGRCATIRYAPSRKPARPTVQRKREQNAATPTGTRTWRTATDAASTGRLTTHTVAKAPRNSQRAKYRYRAVLCTAWGDSSVQ